MIMDKYLNHRYTHGRYKIGLLLDFFYKHKLLKNLSLSSSDLSIQYLNVIKFPPANYFDFLDCHSIRP